MKKLVIVFIVFGILVVGGYIYLRSSLDTKGFQPIKQAAAAVPKPAESPLDLRPQVIAKLQQLVKEGSNGLYNLSMREIKPDIINSKLKAKHVEFLPDMAVLKKLDENHEAPDDVFKISCDDFYIDGIGITAFLSKDKIDVKTVYINHPAIEVLHKSKAYNEKQQHAPTLYQRLMKQMKHIGIGKIVVRGGTLSNHDLKKNTITKFRNIDIRLLNILIDSTTQYDKSRFFFAKNGELSTKNLVLPTRDHLYDFKLGTVSISTATKLLKATEVRFQPRYSKLEFSKHISKQKQWYDFHAASLLLKDIDWWNLMNGDRVSAKEGEINSAKLNLYYDLSLPADSPHLHNFPHQMLMNVPIPVSLGKLKINNLDLFYEEYHPKKNVSGKLYFDKMRCVLTNITNIPSQIKQNSSAVATASALFMHRIPASATFRFDLANYKTGAFAADVKMGGFDGRMLNSLAEPFGSFYVKRGKVNLLQGTMSGDNYHGTGKMLFLYDSLHITPLKREEEKPAGFKKKHVFSFIANNFVLKNENPSGNAAPRSPEGTYKRDPQSNFFNEVWKTILVSVLKTIGAPEKLAY